MHFKPLSVIVVASLLASCRDAGDKPTTINRQKDFLPAVFTDSSRAPRVREFSAIVDSMFARYARKNHLPGIAFGVVIDDQLVHTSANGWINLEQKLPARTTSLFRIASMSKSFTAMAILKLRDAGKLQLEDPAEKYVPSMKQLQYLNEEARPITIKNLLTMTAGFPEDNPWGDRQLDDTDEELEALIAEGLSFSSNPGQQFEYSNLGYAILGHIIGKVSGKPYQEYITQEILQPLGMTGTIWEFGSADTLTLAMGYRWEDERWKREPMLHDGAYGAMGGLITTAEDFARYVSLHLRAWPPGDQFESRVIDRASIREMHEPTKPRLIANAQLPGGQPCPILVGYGYGLGHREDCKGTIRTSHSGGLPGFGSEFRFYREYGIGIFSFANRTYAGMGQINGRVLDTLVTLAGLKPMQLPASGILEKRATQLQTLLSGWDENLGKEILAENFFLDREREVRSREADSLLSMIGGNRRFGAVVPENQLRGTFSVTGDKGTLKVFFTLTPERDPKVQQLDIWVADPEN